MAFFSKLKERLFKSSSKIEDGLDAIVDDGGSTDPVADAPEAARMETPEAEPAPLETPQPEAAPEPIPAETPEPEDTPAPDPVPAPVPNAAATPEPEVTPEPEPAPIPEPQAFRRSRQSRPAHHAPRHPNK